ncbi:ArsC family transcriptional regulator [Pectobacterium brasiliense]|uniref:ArsC family reductase n=1 Tax=Pectobacterium TaxID=122277 RepID=UPI00057F3903|nr:ArsC family reductase [Pectobacterium brasiliense]KHS69424.1 ArsC family transcriptional regulator [Pectobacterium brasiliense]KHS90029.1 ArsC family transcriptional regulator [Pectobacterium brasiliense]MDY4350258.1 ArsC family reductase [Pectobacterium brasiliense]QRN35370.1 ArsC family reductase [Pectobacterium brasiliense]
MALTMYGIKNCDTIKKARRWLDDQQVAYRFHDYRADGLDEQLLQRFIDQLGFQALLNTRGTTWRKLSEELRERINSDTSDSAEASKNLMLEQPAVIKRPLLITDDGHALLGFSIDSYQKFIAENK